MNRTPQPHSLQKSRGYSGKARYTQPPLWLTAALRCLLLMASMSLLPAGATPDKQPEVELLHWWVSPAEHEALELIGKAIEQQGGKFTAISMKNQATVQATVLKRLSLGYPPTVTQWLGGKNMVELYALDGIELLPTQWRKEPLEKVLFPEVWREVTHANKIVALPVVLHIQNTAFYNTAIYQQLKLSPPRSWKELIQQARTIQQAGHVPLALSAEAWQLRMLFNTILLEVLEPSGFRQFYDEKLPVAPHQRQLQLGLDYFLQLKAFVEQPDAELPWNETVSKLATGKAAMLVLGDFATGELTTAKKVAGKDFLCALAPGTENAMIYALDSFILLKVDEPHLQRGQQQLVDAVIDPKVQAAFNERKGGIPVRQGIDPENMDECTAARYQSWLSKNTQKLSPPDSHSRLRLSLVEKSLKKIWSQEMSPEQATQLMIRQIDQP